MTQKIKKESSNLLELFNKNREIGNNWFLGTSDALEKILNDNIDKFDYKIIDDIYQLTLFRITNEDVLIDTDNIELYYEFMNKSNKEHIHFRFNERSPLYFEKLDLNKEIITQNWKYTCCSDGRIKEQKYFGIKDTLKPIDDYIAEIKESEAYKNSKNVA